MKASDWEISIEEPARPASEGGLCDLCYDPRQGSMTDMASVARMNRYALWSASDSILNDATGQQMRFLPWFHELCNTCGSKCAIVRLVAGYLRTSEWEGHRLAINRTLSSVPHRRMVGSPAILSFAHEITLMTDWQELYNRQMPVVGLQREYVILDTMRGEPDVVAEILDKWCETRCDDSTAINAGTMSNEFVAWFIAAGLVGIRFYPDARHVDFPMIYARDELRGHVVESVSRLWGTPSVCDARDFGRSDESS